VTLFLDDILMEADHVTDAGSADDLRTDPRQMADESVIEVVLPLRRRLPTTFMTVHSILLAARLGPPKSRPETTSPEASAEAGK
jgi:hypothetical protein